MEFWNVVGDVFFNIMKVFVMVGVMLIIIWQQIFVMVFNLKVVFGLLVFGEVLVVFDKMKVGVVQISEVFFGLKQMVFMLWLDILMFFWES